VGLLREPFHPPRLPRLALPFSSMMLGDRLPCHNYATPPAGAPTHRSMDDFGVGVFGNGR
jgi:hypothetical protein